MFLTGKIDGQLDINLLQEALEILTSRHESLRTSVHWENLDSPVQVVRKNAVIPFAFENNHAGSRDKLRSAADRPLFDLTDAPLSSLDLYEVEAGRYQFRWAFHHILADGWSAAIYLEDLIEIYGRLATSGDTNLGELPTLGDYRSHVAGRDVEPGSVELARAAVEHGGV